MTVSKNQIEPETGFIALKANRGENRHRPSHTQKDAKVRDVTKRE